jgi:hypothetical protein
VVVGGFWVEFLKLALDDLYIGFLYSEISGRIMRGEPDVEIIFAFFGVHTVFYRKYSIAIKLGDPDLGAKRQ